MVPQTSQAQEKGAFPYSVGIACPVAQLHFCSRIHPSMLIWCPISGKHSSGVSSWITGVPRSPFLLLYHADWPLVLHMLKEPLNTGNLRLRSAVSTEQEKGRNQWSPLQGRGGDRCGEGVAKKKRSWVWEESVPKPACVDGTLGAWETLESPPTVNELRQASLPLSTALVYQTVTSAWLLNYPLLHLPSLKVHPTWLCTSVPIHMHQIQSVAHLSAYRRFKPHSRLPWLQFKLMTTGTSAITGFHSTCSSLHGTA